MVKELSMDNSILNLGSANELKVNEPISVVSNNEFEKVFETSKTQYIDKKDLKTDSKKVANVAEKSVSKERTNKSSNSDSAATKVTKVNKTKVSEKTSSKSPKTATEKSNLKQPQESVSTQKEVEAVTDAYEFSVKESLTAEKDVSSDMPQSEIPANVIESAELLATTVVENIKPAVNVGVAESVMGAEVENIVLEDNSKTTAQVLVNEIAQNIEEQASVGIEENNSTNDISVEVPSQKEVISNLAEKIDDVENLDTVLKEITTGKDVGIKDSGLNTSVNNNQNLQELIEEPVQTVEKNQLDANTQTQAQTGKFELKEGWETVSEGEQLLTQEELTQLVDNNKLEEGVVADKNTTNNNFEVVDEKENIQKEFQNNIQADEVRKLVLNNADVKIQAEQVKVEKPAIQKNPVETNPKNMRELNVKNVKPHTIEEIGAGKEKALEEKPLEPTIDSEIIEEPVIFDSGELDVNELVSEGQEVKLPQQDVAKKEVKEAVSIDKQQVLDVDVEQNVREDVLQKSENEIQQESASKIDTKDVAKNVVNVKSNKADKEIGLKEKATDDLEPLFAEEELSVEINEVAEGDVEDSKQQASEFVPKNDSAEISKNVEKEYGFGEDVDSYLNNCIKLAFVDTSVKESETPDVISALESKFATDVEVEFSSSDEMVFEDVIADNAEKEQVISLDELVSVDEAEDLNLNLNESFAETNEVSTTSATTNSTTEQMIRYSIEGEYGFEPTMEVSSFRTQVQTSVPQSAPSSARDVLAQLSEKLSTFNLNAGSKLTMQLSPENLGKIEISLVNSAKGIIAEMTVSSDETCEMMKKNIEELKETLQKYGVRFDNVTVKTAAAQQSAANQDYTEQGNAQKHHHEQKREERERDGKQSFDEAFSSFTENEDEE